MNLKYQLLSMVSRVINRNKCYNITMINLNCKRCEKQFSVLNKACLRRYCSDICKYVEAKCEYCDSKYCKVQQNQRFCTKDCSQKAIRSGFYHDSFFRKRYLVLLRDGFRCQYCGRSPRKERNCVLHIDHIKPRSAGGGDELDNLIASCDWCNLGKGSYYKNPRNSDNQ